MSPPAPPASRRRARWREWVALSSLLLAFTALLAGLQVFERIDNLWRDQLGRWTRHAASPGIVLVVIDDRSLADVGRWPWPRTVHAALLDRLTLGRPRAIGLDLILTEPDAADVHLAAAMQRAAPVVLPVLLLDRSGAGSLERVGPTAPLAAAAAAQAHIHLEIDPDGIVRSTFLREGRGDAWWDQFGLAVLRAGGFQPTTLPGRRAPPPSDASGRAWLRDHWMQIPFAGPAGSFRTVSYVDVLRGDVPADTFAGKYVLVGATSAGMGDAYPTPWSAGSELMAGVEISAHVMNALLADLRLERATPAQDIVFALLPVALALLAVMWLAPTASLLGSAALIVLVLLSSALVQRLLGLQLAPSAAVAGVALAYPLWIWRRLRAATDYLLEESARMEQRRDLPAMQPGARTVDLLDRHIDGLRGASEQLRNLHRFVSDTLDSLPDATLIADTGGVVLMHNQMAQRHFGDTALRGQRLDALLRDVLRSGTRQAVLPEGRLAQDPQPWSAEACDARGRDLLAKFAPCFNTDGALTGWIASLTDISAIRAAERQRDVALRFISHDMRSPQSSILALLELHRMTQADAAQSLQPDTVDRIERHARRTLELAEEFVQLARAESSAYQLTLLDLGELLGDAIDEVWPQAQARRVRFTQERPPGPALCEADRGLLLRALANLLGNAVKYGREGGTVDCTLRANGADWTLGIRDQGPGLTPAQQEELFTAWRRLAPEGGSPGVGLGLVFVRTVATRHGGRIEVSSQPGRGTLFELSLPRAEG